MMQDKTNRGKDAVISMPDCILREIEDLAPVPSNCSIYRVPKPLRKIKPGAYTPRMVSIGPFHCDKENLRPMEEHKLRYLNDFLHRQCKEPQAILDDYVKAMEERKDRARQCYSEKIQLETGDKFAKMMLIDGCFILELILKSVHDTFEARHGYDPIMNATWMIHVIKHDLILLENQLPFFVLESLYELFRQNSRYKARSEYERLDTLISRFFQYFVPPIVVIKGSEFNGAATEEYAETLAPEGPLPMAADESLMAAEEESLKKPLLMAAEEESPKKQLPMAAAKEALKKQLAMAAAEESLKKQLPMAVAEESLKKPVLMEVMKKPAIGRGGGSSVVGRREPRLYESEERLHGEISGGAVAEKPLSKEVAVAVAVTAGYEESLPVVENKNKKTKSQAKHLLDFVRDLILKSFSEDRVRGNYVYPRCATELSGASVKFVKEETISLLNIAFNPKTGELKIPTIKIEDGTESLLRNLIAFEQYGNDNYITDYAFFMDGLINSHKDVELLEKKGIIKRLLGEPEEVATLFNGLLKEVIMKGKEYSFSGDCKELEKYYNSPWHNWRASFMLNYCSSPWSCISIFAASLLLILTVAQTICSILALT